LAVGDLVICPVCAEIGVIKEENEKWPIPNSYIIECEDCGSMMTPTKPQRVDTLTIEYPKPNKEGQQEFDFVQNEVKHPGKE